MQIPGARGSIARQGKSPVEEKVMRAGYRPFAVLATVLLACGATGDHQATNLTALQMIQVRRRQRWVRRSWNTIDRPLVFTLSVSENMG
jgi:hypothetical protein